MFEVYVYSGIEDGPPGAIFSSFRLADDWIRRHNLDGTLSVYELDHPLVDDAAHMDKLAAEYFRALPKKQAAEQYIPQVRHWHYMNGQFDHGDDDVDGVE